MMSREDADRVTRLLCDAVGLLSQNSLRYSVDLRVQGLLATAVDGIAVVLVQFAELFRSAAIRDLASPAQGGASGGGDVGEGAVRISSDPTSSVHLGANGGGSDVTREGGGGSVGGGRESEKKAMANMAEEMKESDSGNMSDCHTLENASSDTNSAAFERTDSSSVVSRAPVQLPEPFPLADVMDIYNSFCVVGDGSLLESRHAWPPRISARRALHATDQSDTVEIGWLGASGHGGGGRQGTAGQDVDDGFSECESRHAAPCITARRALHATDSSDVMGTGWLGASEQSWGDNFSSHRRSRSYQQDEKLSAVDRTDSAFANRDHMQELASMKPLNDECLMKIVSAEMSGVTPHKQISAADRDEAIRLPRCYPQFVPSKRQCVCTDANPLSQVKRVSPGMPGSKRALRRLHSSCWKFAQNCRGSCSSFGSIVQSATGDRAALGVSGWSGGLVRKSSIKHHDSLPLDGGCETQSFSGDSNVEALCGVAESEVSSEVGAAMAVNDRTTAPHLVINAGSPVDVMSPACGIVGDTNNEGSIIVDEVRRVMEGANVAVIHQQDSEFFSKQNREFIRQQDNVGINQLDNELACYQQDCELIRHQDNQTSHGLSAFFCSTPRAVTPQGHGGHAAEISPCWPKHLTIREESSPNTNSHIIALPVGVGGKRRKTCRRSEVLTEDMVTSVAKPSRKGGSLRERSGKGRVVLTGRQVRKGVGLGGKGVRLRGEGVGLGGKGWPTKKIRVVLQKLSPSRLQRWESSPTSPRQTMYDQTPTCAQRLPHAAQCTAQQLLQSNLQQQQKTRPPIRKQCVKQKEEESATRPVIIREELEKHERCHGVLYRQLRALEEKYMARHQRQQLMQEQQQQQLQRQLLHKQQLQKEQLQQQQQMMLLVETRQTDIETTNIRTTDIQTADIQSADIQTTDAQCLPSENSNNSSVVAPGCTQEELRPTQAEGSLMQQRPSLIPQPASLLTCSQPDSLLTCSLPVTPMLFQQTQPADKPRAAKSAGLFLGQHGLMLQQRMWQQLPQHAQQQLKRQQQRSTVQLTDRQLQQHSSMVEQTREPQQLLKRLRARWRRVAHLQPCAALIAQLPNTDSQHPIGRQLDQCAAPQLQLIGERQAASSLCDPETMLANQRQDQRHKLQFIGQQSELRHKSGRQPIFHQLDPQMTCSKQAVTYRPNPENESQQAIGQHICQQASMLSAEVSPALQTSATLGYAVGLRAPRNSAAMTTRDPSHSLSAPAASSSDGIGSSLIDYLTGGVEGRDGGDLEGIRVVWAEAAESDVFGVKGSRAAWRTGAISKGVRRGAHKAAAITQGVASSAARKRALNAAPVSHAEAASSSAGQTRVAQVVADRRRKDKQSVVDAEGVDSRLKIGFSKPPQCRGLRKTGKR